MGFWQRLTTLATASRAYRVARRARSYARHRGLDLSFADFGTSVGWRLLRNRERGAIEALIAPVHDTRYWEFGFVWAAIRGTYLLDVSSPRLLALRLASERPNAEILAINPDPADIGQTRRHAALLGLENLQTRALAIEELNETGFDCAWSISVIEHIDDDSEAVRRIWGALRPGGRMILTVPVDQRHWDEYRPFDQYRLRGPREGPVFFQRFYTEATLRDRLLSGLPGGVARLAWWGEKAPGVFQAHIARWQAHGYDETATDPRHVVDHYQAYTAWDAMPGFGVCGITIDKPE